RVRAAGIVRERRRSAATGPSDRASAGWVVGETRPARGFSASDARPVHDGLARVSTPPEGRRGSTEGRRGSPDPAGRLTEGLRIPTHDEPGCRSVDDRPVGRTFLSAEELVVGQTFLSATTTATSGFRPLGRESFRRGWRDGWLRGGLLRGIMDLRNRARARVAGLGTVLLSNSTRRRQLGASHGLGHPILD